MGMEFPTSITGTLHFIAS